MNLAKLSIQRPIFITCLVILMLLIGALSFFKLGVDQFPDVTFPVVVVSTEYPGASPEEVETLISRPLEEQISSISGIKRLNSTSQEGRSFVVAEFTLGVDIKYAEQQVRDKTALARPNLPTDAKDSVVSRVDVSDVPVLRLSVSGELAPAQLYDIVENFVKPRLEQVTDVGQVDILGGNKREIKVEVDRKKLKQREVSLTSLAQKISSSAQNVPVGKIDTNKETVFRTIGEYKSIEQIKNTLVNFFGSDVSVRVGDVATVTDSVQDERNRAFINGQAAILLDIHKQSGTNTVSVAEGVNKKLISINADLAKRPGNLKIALVRDGAKFIRANVEDVKESIILGIILAVVVVFLFLGNWRSTIITGLALPNSLLGAFILMYIMGFTINVMTLLALSLAVGLLIDDAIVVRENIFRRLEEGESPLAAAEHGTNEVTMASAHLF
jgi:HAE1 family hydrophobic/amphiphilic exporter-1